MERNLTAQLVEWKDKISRKPLLLRGARQVGKSYVVNEFAKDHFDSFVEVNFEFDARYIACFESFDPKAIIALIGAYAKQTIVPGKTLLFLDEIQECPKAILALRYFKEKMPQLHVIGAGSLLELTLQETDYRQPVGRVESLYMKPCSFLEYLTAMGYRQLVEMMADVRVGSAVPPAMHALLLEKCREYFVLGGMPEVIESYRTQQQYYECEKIQGTILDYYHRDFPKYAKKTDYVLLDSIFKNTVNQLGKDIKYSRLASNRRARDVKVALAQLENAGLVQRIFNSSAAGLPLSAGINEKKFKLIHLDIGLAKHATGIDMMTLMQEHLILVNRGAFAEQFVGQELLAYAHRYEPASLYYWSKDSPNSMAEVDYVIQHRSKIYPVEVKAGITGRLKSLQIFMQDKKCDLGIRISQQQFSLEKNVLSIPLYMVHELPRLLDALAD